MDRYMDKEKLNSQIVWLINSQLCRRASRSESRTFRSTHFLPDPPIHSNPRMAKSHLPRANHTPPNPECDQTPAPRFGA